MSRTDRMPSDLSRTGPVERDIEQVLFYELFSILLRFQLDHLQF